MGGGMSGGGMGGGGMGGGGMGGGGMGGGGMGGGGMGGGAARHHPPEAFCPHFLVLSVQTGACRSFYRVGRPQNILGAW